ncbi:MAG: hypothetical protein NC412_08460 [Roseburia sp.]|nr:hypothetical protein [Roseburia sp.]MCM1279616.1 hypothetical protein [Robinsoniella sp.]
MSLIQAIITEDFVLAGADKREIGQSGSFSENFNRLIKINRNIIFGCSGNMENNEELFKDYCTFSSEGLIRTEKDIDLSYNEFIEIVSDRFQKTRIKVESNKSASYASGSIVCGFNGKEFETTIFNLNNYAENLNCMMKVTKSPNLPYKVIACGNPNHLDRLNILISLYRPSTILQYKNIMKIVFEEGIEFDSTINKNYCFEYIK